MDEDDIQALINGTVHYFNQSSSETATVGTPFLAKEEDTVPLDYTGIIGISGKRKGSVYFTAPKSMLRVLLMSLGEEENSHDNFCDLVGEVANTISGNARRDYGKDFMISVPVVVVGNVEKIRTPPDLRAFVIPITWRSHQCNLVICLE